MSMINRHLPGVKARLGIMCFDCQYLCYHTLPGKHEQRINKYKMNSSCFPWHKKPKNSCNLGILNVQLLGCNMGTAGSQCWP